MDLISPLKEFGLSDKEIDVYLCLLPLGTINLQEIAKRLKYPRTTTYNTLNYLISKGLVSKIIVKGINHFTATDPNKFIDKLDAKKRLISSILPNLENLKGTIKTLSNVEMYEGLKGVFTILSDVFKIKQKTYYFGGYKGSVDILKHVPENARRARIENNIFAEIVIDEAEEKTFHTKKYKQLTKMRFNSALRDFPVMIFIYGEKVAMYSVKGDLVGMIISNKEFSIAMKMIFDVYWNQGKDVKL